MEKFKDTLDEDISSLFNDVRNKLRSLYLQSKQQKKQIITDLALALEGKISIDSICIEIVNKLRGQVSDRFIRESLDEKYKQKIRVDNAKKQIKNNNALKDDYNKVIAPLAEITPLKPQPEQKVNGKTKKNENRQVIMVDTFGSMVFQESQEGNNPLKEDQQTILTILPDVLDNRLVLSLRSKEQTSNRLRKKELEECNSCMELYHENCQLKEILQKSSQLIIPADQINTKVSSESTTIKVYTESIDDYLPFGFSKTFREIREYMAPLYDSIGDNGLIWFNGKVDTKTGKTVLSRFGKQNIQSENSRQGY